MELTFLGTADAFNSAGRGNSCYWIDDAHGSYVVDFGPTALLQCRRLGLDPGRLDVVYLTHLHGDHIGGLALLYIDLLFVRRRTRPLTIFGPEGPPARVEALFDSAYPAVVAKGAGFEVRFVEWAVPGVHDDGPRRIRTLRARHDTHAIASSLRIESSAEPTVAFSGDTGWQPELVEFVAGAEAFICECSMVDAIFWGHLSLEEIRAHRAALDVGQLYLSHLGDDSRVAAVAAADELGLRVAEDGLRISLGEPRPPRPATI
ncbi:MAG: MBL fold metallo-hydrolase [bacterium]